MIKNTGWLVKKVLIELPTCLTQQCDTNYIEETAWRLPIRACEHNGNDQKSLLAQHDDVDISRYVYWTLGDCPQRLRERAHLAERY